MPFLGALAVPLLIGGATTAIGAIANRGGGSSSSSSSTASAAQLDPLIKLQTTIAEAASKQGQEDISAARGGLNFVGDFYKNILQGSDDDLLKLLDVSGATRNIDENEQLTSELAVRGGRRAATLGNANFARDAAVNNMLKQLRFAAPNQLMQLNQILGNIGLGELSAATGAGAQASNSIISGLNVKNDEADRRTNLISSIMSTAGNIAGIIAAG